MIAQYLPADRAAFDRNPPVQSHIYRHVMIVGEAAWNLSQPLKDRNPQVPWKQIEGMRHIMVHDYFKVDWDIGLYNCNDGHSRTEAADRSNAAVAASGRESSVGELAGRAN